MEIALGFFDGVHLGHAELIKRLGADARALTFSAPPGGKGLLVNSFDERLTMLRELGAEPLVMPFDETLRSTPWDAFIDTLITVHGARKIVAGYDFRFGRGGDGDAVKLAEYCAGRGAACEIVPEVKVGGETVSSSALRDFIARGEPERIRAFTGRDWFVTGTVAHGRRIGAELGAPTLNLALDPERVAPRFGVYATETDCGGETHKSATNVGVRPTIDVNGAPNIETTLINYSGDLYGQPVKIRFLRFIRGERKFADASELSRQIKADIAEILRRY